MLRLGLVSTVYKPINPVSICRCLSSNTPDSLSATEKITNIAESTKASSKFDDFLQKEGFSLDKYSDGIQQVTTNFSEHGLGLCKTWHYLMPQHYFQGMLDVAINTFSMDHLPAILLCQLVYRLLTSRAFLQCEVNEERRLREADELPMGLVSKAQQTSASKAKQISAHDLFNSDDRFAKLQKKIDIANKDRSFTKQRSNYLQYKLTSKYQRQQYYSVFSGGNRARHCISDESVEVKAAMMKYDQHRWAMNSVLKGAKQQLQKLGINDVTKHERTEQLTKGPVLAVQLIALRQMTRSEFPFETTLLSGKDETLSLLDADPTHTFPKVYCLMQALSFTYLWRNQTFDVLRKARIPISIGLGLLLYQIMQNREMVMLIALTTNCFLTLSIKIYSESNYFRKKHKMMSLSEQLLLRNKLNDQLEDEFRKYRGVSKNLKPKWVNDREEYLNRSFIGRKLQEKDDMKEIAKQRTKDKVNKRKTKENTTLSYAGAQHKRYSEARATKSQKIEHLKKTDTSFYRFKSRIMLRRQDDRKVLGGLVTIKGKETMSQNLLGKIMAKSKKTQGKNEVKEEISKGQSTKLYPITEEVLNASAMHARAKPDYEFYDQRHDFKPKFKVRRL